VSVRVDGCRNHFHFARRTRHFQANFDPTSSGMIIAVVSAEPTLTLGV